MKRIIFITISAFLLLALFSAPISEIKAQEEGGGSDETPAAAVVPPGATCKTDCKACPTTNKDCSNRPTYDTCIDLERNTQSSPNFCKNSKYYRCYASDNPNCSSSYTLLCNQCANGKNQDKNPPQNTATCYTDCKACDTKYTLGQNTYDTCKDDKGGSTANGTLCTNKEAKKFECKASLNNSCQSGAMEYDCPSTGNTPPVNGTGNSFQVVISTSCNGNAGNTGINVSWSNPVHSNDGNYYYPKSMKLELYKSGSITGNICIDTNKQSNYTFSGNYNSTEKIEIAASAYNETDCTGRLLASNDKQIVTNASCSPGQTGPGKGYELDRLFFGKQAMDVTGTQTRTYHLDGKNGEPKSFPTKITAEFLNGSGQVTKPYYINFVYRPKQGGKDPQNYIYNISPAPGTVYLSKNEGVIFKWAAIDGVKKYRLIAATSPYVQGPSGSDNNCPSPDNGWLVCKELTQTSYTVANNIFIDGVNTFWWVMAFDDKGNAVESGKWRIVTSGATPERKKASCEQIPCPTNLEGPSNGIVYGLTPVTLAWTNPSPEYKYATVVISPAGEGSFISKTVENKLNRNTLIIQASNINSGSYNLLPGTTYKWIVFQAKDPGDFWKVDSNGTQQMNYTEGPSFKTSVPSSSSIKAVEPQINSVVSSLTPTLIWSNDNPAIYYYELQLSKDKTFETDPKIATAAVQDIYIHGGKTTPVNSYHVPVEYNLDPSTKYYWRLRPRTGDKDTVINWSDTWTFTTPDR